MRFFAAAFAALTLVATTQAAFARPVAPTAFHEHGKSMAMVRVVHGSPDAGPVTVSVNGGAVLKNFLYGTVTPYISLAAGSYTLAVTTAGGATVSANVTLTGGTLYSVVATGELAPAANPSKPNVALTAYVDKPFAKKGSAINFHHGAPVVNSSVPFGIALLSNETKHNAQLGSASFGAETGPLAIPMADVKMPLEAYAASYKDFTLIPNQLDPNDFENLLPGPAGNNLSVFAVDGPAAASDPTVAGTDAVRLIGTFDK